jgi:hypothetical protein
VLCGVTHPLARLPPWSEVQPALERVALALFCDDHETVCFCVVLFCVCVVVVVVVVVYEID